MSLERVIVALTLCLVEGLLKIHVEASTKMLRPLELDLHTSWMNALGEMNLKPRYERIKDILPRFYGGCYGCKRSNYLGFVYIRIRKGGNNAIIANMNLNQPVLQSEKHEVGCKCLHKANAQNYTSFTFVRHPIDHLLSGYNEAEYRNLNCTAHKGILSLCDYGRGTPERFKAFIVDILDGNFVLASRSVQNHITHAFPMSVVLNHIRPSIIYELRQIHKVWAGLLRKLIKNSELPEVEKQSLLPQVKPFQAALGQHASSSDKYGFYKAAKAAVATDRPLLRAICSMYFVDFLAFGYRFPDACTQDLGSDPNVPYFPWIEHLQWRDEVSEQ